jgi:hypothetical protein
LKRWVSRRRSDKNPTSPKSADPSSEEEYEEPFQRPDGIYARIDDICEETISRSSVSEDSDASGYTELDSAYISVSQKPYGKLLRNPPKSELVVSLPALFIYLRVIGKGIYVWLDNLPTDPNQCAPCITGARTRAQDLPSRARKAKETSRGVWGRNPYFLRHTPVF